MRHSSWTLFLVPLAFPLVLLLPGATKKPDSVEPVANYEQVQSEWILPFENLSGPSTPSEEPARDLPEALYKD
ncbi:MAG: hypothetical protein PVJ76_17950 [Gemmatimonadota bacterium]|jgi:hypothetical protein